MRFNPENTATAIHLRQTRPWEDPFVGASRDYTICPLTRKRYQQGAREEAKRSRMGSFRGQLLSSIFPKTRRTPDV